MDKLGVNIKDDIGSNSKVGIFLDIRTRVWLYINKPYKDNIIKLSLNIHQDTIKIDFKKNIIRKWIN